MALEKLNKAARRIASRIGGDSGIVVTLKGEHAEIVALMRRIGTDGGDVTTRREGYARVREALLQHARAEMEVFYPACQAYPELRAMIRDDLAEHDQIEERLAILDATEASTQDWLDHVALLEQLIEHHVKEEEERLLPLVSERMSSAELSELDPTYRNAKQRIADATLAGQPHATFGPN